jgi:DNA adenine methylase
MKLNQPFSWMGSKCRLRGRLYPIFATIPRALYVEPFGGSGAVFFGKSPENSVYNDCNRLLTNFFKVIRSAANRCMIQELVEITPTSEIYFYEFKELALQYIRGEDCAATLDALNLRDYPADVAVAFAFFYVQNNCFGGKCCETFGRQLHLETGGGTFLPRSYHANATQLAGFANKLKLTQIICKDWRQVLCDYDAETTFFYIDPPYECKGSKDYKTGWTTDDTRDLVAACLELRGAFVLSCYDDDLYKPLLQVATVKNWDAMVSLAKGKNNKVVETVYIKNNLKTLF